MRSFSMCENLLGVFPSPHHGSSRFCAVIHKNILCGYSGDDYKCLRNISESNGSIPAYMIYYMYTYNY